MLKLSALSMLVCAAGMTGFYAGALPQPSIGTDAGPAAAAPHMRSLETDLLAAPSIADGSLDGFFFLRLVYGVNDMEASKLGVDLNLIVSDSFYDFLLGGKITHAIHDSAELNALTQGLMTEANELAGLPLVGEIYLTQVDYFAGDEARKASVERRKMLKSDDKTKLKPAPAAH
jgi:hypothetical protein